MFGNKALNTIDEKIMYHKEFIRHKCKQRLTKLTQMIKRMRKLKLKAQPQLTVIKRKSDQRDRIRMVKAEKRAQVSLNIEKELLDRLKMGTYAELYDDLLNLNQNAFEKHVQKQNAQKDMIDEYDDLEEDIDDIEIENDFEYVFNQANDDDIDEQEDSKPNLEKKKKIQKRRLVKNIKVKKIELLLEDDELETEQILN